MALGAFTVIVVAELGDLTQILTANLVARYHNPLSVFVGSATALVTVMGVGVIGGRVLLRVLPLATIRKVAGVILVGFAIFTAVQAARGERRRREESRWRTARKQLFAHARAAKGFMPDDEGAALFDAARRAGGSGGATGTFVEVGAWCGKSDGLPRCGGRIDGSRAVQHRPSPRLRGEPARVGPPR